LTAALVVWVEKPEELVAVPSEESSVELESLLLSLFDAKNCQCESWSPDWTRLRGIQLAESVVDESELVWVAVASVAVPVEVELVAVGPLPPQKWEL
jgi:hypothetical protein